MKKLLFAVLSFFTFSLFAQTVPAVSETMVVTAIRAEEETPVTKTDIPREEIEQRYHGQDVPLLLRDAPSINAYTESGVGGAGYSYISLRGISPTRVNFTLDGVPLADSEDMGTFFADFPDLARSLESIQIQRGVGTSTVGTPSFGGSVNMESIALGDPFVSATIGLGSYGNRQVSAGALVNAPLDTKVYARLSFLENDGYRDRSGMQQRNLFLSAEKDLAGGSRLKLTGFTGHERQQLSFYASDAETLTSNPRDNPLRPEEKDSFGYDLAQLSYMRPVGSTSAVTASAYYQRGYGWYRLFDFDNVLREYGLDGRLLGAMLTYAHFADALTVNAGVHVNRFQRDHTRDDLSTGTRDYGNYGVKGEANAFAKVEYDVNRWHLYGDAQVRRADFDYHGDADIRPVSWTFFNPKIGARYRTSARSTVYASFGTTTREPTRNDLFLGEDNPSVAHNLRAVRPERVYDLEAGWRFHTASVDLGANVYAMEMRNEIASTGELSEIGLLLRRNVDRSHRRGLELDLAWQAARALRLRTSANLSRNRIEEWTQFYDATAITYRNVEPLLTPGVIVSQAADYSPSARLTVGGIGRWVGRSYLDNTNNDDLVTPSFFTLDANVSYAVTSQIRVSLQVNNALGNDRVYASGYSYLYLDENGAATGIPYYYPQAGRNAVVLLDVDL